LEGSSLAPAGDNGVPDNCDWARLGEVDDKEFWETHMVRKNKLVALVRDLTDTMYNPARSPYVSHDEGTRLVVSFIEKFWCPTVDSSQVLKD